MTGDWRPAATVATLRRRALLLTAAREFFRERGVMEVETPVVTAYTVTDAQIESLQLARCHGSRWLRTSPEYAMKRLLAAGSGDIYQICRVFRAGEHGRLHNPEFTMIEWYRLGQGLESLMRETAGLVSALFEAGGAAAVPFEALSYSQAFRQALSCDPLSATDDELATLAQRHGLVLADAGATARNDLLDFLIATVVGPRLGRGCLAGLHHYPAGQAALAQLDAGDPRTALRFELYAEGVELANGYVELAAADEQRARFALDLAERRRRGRVEPAVDERLLAAMAAGLPACSGVALGFDRVAMLALGATSVSEVMAFDWDGA